MRKSAQQVSFLCSSTCSMVLRISEPHGSSPDKRCAKTAVHRLGFILETLKQQPCLLLCLTEPAHPLVTSHEASVARSCTSACCGLTKLGVCAGQTTENG